MIDLKKKYWIILGGFALLTIGGLLFTLRRKKVVKSNVKSSSTFKTKLVDLANSEWEKWNKSREELADKIVRALQNAYTDKTTFKGTISDIYNKLTK